MRIDRIKPHDDRTNEHIEDCKCSECVPLDGQPLLIKTRFTYPPIPSRAFDWAAYVDGQEHGPIGHGKTEADAVADLREQLDDDRELTYPGLSDESAGYGTGWE